MKSVKALLVIACIAILAIILIIGKIRSPSTGSRSLFPTPIPEKTQYTYLLLGYGGANHDGPYLTDSIMAVYLDTKAKKIILISVPRDIWITLPTKSQQPFGTKINALFQMTLFPQTFPDVDEEANKKNGTILITQAVNHITGKYVDGYLGVDFDGFIQFIDMIGGIDVIVDTSFVDTEYPVDGKEDEACGHTDAEITSFTATASGDMQLRDFFPCRYETLNFTAGQTHMDGKTTLKYARSRHSLEDGTDFGRASRQQKVIQAVKEKVLSIGFIPKIIPVMNELKKHLKTDISLSDIQTILSQAPYAKSYTVTSLVISDKNYVKNGSSPDGQFILQSEEGTDSWTKLQADIANVIAGITPTPTATASATLQP